MLPIVCKRALAPNARVNVNMRLSEAPQSSFVRIKENHLTFSTSRLCLFPRTQAVSVHRGEGFALGEMERVDCRGGKICVDARAGIRAEDSFAEHVR